MTPRLVAISSPYTGKIWAVSDAGLKVGRAADNDVCIPDWLVSRHHFHIEFFDGGFWLCDGDTLNGTWVFDQACSRKRLQHGDRIKCGSATFLYLELESSDDDLAVITRAETQRIYQFPTPRADHSGETDVAVARDGALKVLFDLKSPNLLPGGSGKINKDKVTALIKIVLSAFVDNADQTIFDSPRVGICQNPVDLSENQRRFVIFVIDA